MTDTLTTPQIDPSRVEEFVGQLLTDFAGAGTTAMIVIGDRLGLYRALADNGPLTDRRPRCRHRDAPASGLSSGPPSRSSPATSSRRATSSSCPPSTRLRCRWSTPRRTSSGRPTSSPAGSARSPSSRRRSAGTAAWTTPPCRTRSTTASSGSSARPTSTSSCRPGSPRCPGSSTGSTPARGSPTSAAGTAWRRG